MNWNIVEGNWKQLKGKLAKHWGNLTNHQVEAAAGKRVELAGKVQAAYGQSEKASDKKIKQNAIGKKRNKASQAKLHS